MTPEHFLRRFEHHLSKNPGDQQMSLGVQISRHRQGYDLQLSQYDDKGWRATFDTTGMEHSPTRDGHRVGTDALARDAAGGVGRTEEEARE
jgi:hypothetical protein